MDRRVGHGAARLHRPQPVGNADQPGKAGQGRPRRFRKARTVRPIESPAVQAASFASAARSGNYRGGGDATVGRLKQDS
jgi:hypothetical protein